MMLLGLDIPVSASKAPSHVRWSACVNERFPRVTTDMNALESEFLEYQAIPYDEFLTYFDEDDKSFHIDLIWH